MLLSGVARLTRHAGQSRLLLTLAHETGNHDQSNDLQYPQRS